MSSKLLYKWLYGILTKPLTILKSIYYRLLNKNKDARRLSICNQCEHKLNTKFGDICDLCGCILDNKTRIEEERCELDKW